MSVKSYHAAVFVLLVVIAVPLRAEDAVSFQRDVLPLLSDRCFQCHGPDEASREADLRLDQREHVVEDRGDDWIIKAGDPSASELVARITTDDESLRMPPEDAGPPLSDRETELLVRWIEQGAEWSRHWAYETPRWTSSPTTNQRPHRHWVDAWIEAGAQRQGLQLSEPADPVTLVRRLSFDLTGLPPSANDVRALVANPTDTEYARLVDRLLNSPQFGERMATYWLDLVRFADTVGYHGDQDHRISPYRDWVIDAFNDNLPFDQMTRCQLAGDLLESPTTDDLIATGYNRLLQTSHEGGVQPKEYLAIYAADRVRNVSAVWLGATLGCAQCHNHKYDPYSSRDFYAMAAFFADVDEAQHFKIGTNDLPTARPPEIEVLSGREREILAAIEGELATTSDTNRTAELQASIQRLNAAKRLTMITVATDPRVVRLLPRGNWLDETGPVVQPAFPECLSQPASPEAARLNRLDLANWLTDPEDGIGLLTSRVMVNRLWFLAFGRGLAPVLDDFGAQGSPPDHPELLDNLAVSFVQSGWDMKAMMRMLVMTDAYRRSSAATDQQLGADPENRWFARQSRFRLPAEMVRDNALAVSGLLVQELGGPSVKPYQPAGYYRHLNFPVREYQSHHDRRQWRRGVYVHWQRQFLHPMLKAFDAPSREECTAIRSRSNTPLSALALLNDPTFVEAARVFAEHVLRESDRDDRERLAEAFQQATSRAPDELELQLLTDLLAQSWQQFSERSQSAADAVKVGLSPVNFDGLDVELAAWTTVTRALLNLNETLVRY